MSDTYHIRCVSVSDRLPGSGHNVAFYVQGDAIAGQMELELPGASRFVVDSSYPLTIGEEVLSTLNPDQTEQLKSILNDLKNLELLVSETVSEPTRSILTSNLLITTQKVRALLGEE